MQQLPKDWKSVKLGDLCEKMANGTNVKQSDEKIGFPISRIETIWNETIDLSRVKYISENDTQFVEKYSLRKDDILFSHINSDIHLGKTAIFKNQISTLIHGINLLLIRLRKAVSADFLNYQFKYKKKRGEFIAIAQKSVNQSSINQQKLKNIDFFLPPLQLQEAIVSKIEELFSELDKGIEQLKAAQQQLNTYRQAVLKWAFEGKLTNENVKDGELLKGWKLAKISDFVSVNPKLPGKETIDKNLEVQFLPMKLVEELINKIHLTEAKQFKDVQKGSYTPFIDGDIIFAKVTPCMENGKIAIVENLKNGIGFGSSEFHVIRCGEALLNKYIFYFLIRDWFRKEAESAMTGAVGLRRVPKQFIENYQILIPKFEEQKQIVEEIENRLNVANKMEESISQSLQQADVLRQSILKMAFEGRLIAAVEIEITKQEPKVIPIERKILAGKIIHLFYDDKYFGLTKFQKTLYIAEHYTEVDYEMNYLQERAGPYDRDFTLAFRKEASEEDCKSRLTSECARLRWMSTTSFDPGVLPRWSEYHRRPGTLRHSRPSRSPLRAGSKNSVSPASSIVSR